LEIKNLFGGIYKNKKVLLTGHTGFKGSWMALWLKQLGAQVIGLSLEPPTNPNHHTLLNLDITSIIGDIRNKKIVIDAVNAHNPDIIFHMAAQPLVLYSYENPSETYETNVLGTLNVFEAARLAGTTRAIVCITTDKCYENMEWERGYREDDRLGGHDPYSSSKACAEILAASYRNSFFNLEKYDKDHNTLLATVRAGNVIGGGDWADNRLIPDIMKSVPTNTEVIIRRPNATRPWQHVLEPLSGYLMVGEKLLMGDQKFAEAWNFGPDEVSTVKVEDIVKLIKKKWPQFRYKIENNQSAPHEAKLLQLDSSKATTRLEWRPLWDAETAIEKTIDWYLKFYNAEKITSLDNLYEYTKNLFY